MTNEENAYFLTNDELYWLIETNFDSLDDYARERFNAIEHIINSLDNDGLSLINTWYYQMIKERWTWWAHMKLLWQLKKQLQQLHNLIYIEI